MIPRRSSPAKGSRAASAARAPPAGPAPPRGGCEGRARLSHDCRRPVADASAAAFSVEQTKAELGLKLENLTAQSRLAHVARCRRAAKMAVVGDRDHIFEVSEVHNFKDWRRRSLVKGQSIGPIGRRGLSTSKRNGSDAQAPYAADKIVLH